jgi:hypothetical protein
MTDLPKLIYEDKDGSRLEIQAGSHVFVKQDEEEGTYWEWQKIPALHEALQQMFSQAEENLNQISSLLSDLPKNEIK